MKKIKIQERKGFTLLEMMMVIAIIGILSSLILVSVDRDSGVVQSAAREFATDLRSLKRSALNGTIPTGGGYACEFRLNPIVASFTSYTFSFRSKNSPTDACSGFNTYAPYNPKALKNGVFFRDGVGELIFSVPHGEVITGGGVIYTLKRGSKCAGVTVSVSGDIVEDGLSDCP
ncbi:MAG: type II secretion system protein [Candidatus Moraniibacteriota bacterium]|nr:MAG: type II secretion system protein [Candidatus Moranbacteria bacterium]